MAAPVFDAVTATSGTADLSATHTPVGTPKGVTVLIVQDASITDLIAGVTYGGVALTRVHTQSRTGGGELGRTYAYHLGTGIPTGPQTVAVDQTGSAQIWATCTTVTATADTEIADSAGVVDTTTLQSNPTATIPTLAGFNGIVLACLFSGVSAVGTPVAGSGYTELAEFDFTSATVANAIRGARSGANVVANWTIATADDAAVSAVAVQEAVSTSTVGRSFAVPYAVIAAVGRSFAIPYGMAGVIGRSFAAPYAILGPVLAGIEFRAAGSSTFTLSRSPVITRDAAVLAGDVILVVIATDTAFTEGPVTGWEVVGTREDQPTSGPDTSVLVLRHVVEASPPATWTLTNVMTANKTGIVGWVAYVNVDSTSPVNTNAQSNATGATHETSQVTPSVADCMIVGIGGADPGASGRAATPAASSTGQTGTERVDAVSGTTGHVFIEDYQQAAAAAIALKWSVDGAVIEGYGCFIVALNPGAAPPTTVGRSFTVPYQVIAKIGRSFSLVHSVLGPIATAVQQRSGARATKRGVRRPFDVTGTRGKIGREFAFPYALAGRVGRSFGTSYVMAGGLAAAAVYVDAVNGDDAYTPTQAQSIDTPWKTLQKARDSAPDVGGSTVYVRSGTYTNLQIVSKTRTNILTFKPYAGELVTLAGQADAASVLANRSFYVSNSSHFRFEGFVITGGCYVVDSSFVEIVGNDCTGVPALSQTGIGMRFRRSTDVLFENNHVHYYRGAASAVVTAGALAEIGMVRFTIRGNEIHDCEYDAMSIYWKLTDVTIEDNYVHDINRPPGSTSHTDGIQIAPQSEGGLRVTVRRNRIIRCFQGLFLKDGPQTDLVIENNVVMERLSTATAFSLYNAPGARIVNNTFANMWLRGATAYPPSTGLIVQNNNVLGDITRFTDNATAALTTLASDKNNLAATYTGFTKDASDTIGSATFIDAAGSDYRLASGSLGVDGGVASAFTPGADLNGNPRPVGAAPDIGAYERQVGDP